MIFRTRTCQDWSRSIRMFGNESFIDKMCIYCHGYRDRNILRCKQNRKITPFFLQNFSSTSGRILRCNFLQKTLPETLENGQKLPIHSDKAQFIHKILFEYLMQDMVPFSAVSGRGFLRFCQVCSLTHFICFSW